LQRVDPTAAYHSKLNVGPKPVSYIIYLAYIGLLQAVFTLSHTLHTG